MSLHRRAAKRDAAEPEIVKMLEAHGCIVWRVSGKGLADLVVFHPKARKADGFGTHRHTFVADVKGPKEKATPAQEEKWGALTALGFAVFILRTPEDAVKMLNNALAAWEPAPHGGYGAKQSKTALSSRKGDAAKRSRCGKNGCRNLRPCVDHDGTMKRTTMEVTENYTPPRSKPVAHRSDCEQVYHKDDREPCTCGALDAAKEAEVFAPANAVADDCGCRNDAPCALHRVYCEPGAL